MTVAMLAGLVLAAATAQDGAAAQPRVAAPPAQTDPAAGQPNHGASRPAMP